MNEPLNEGETLLSVAVHGEQVAVMVAKSKTVLQFHLGSYAGFILALIDGIAHEFGVSKRDVFIAIASNADIDLSKHMKKPS